MTDEILKKGKELQSEISDLKYLKYYLAEYVFKLKIEKKKKGKILAKRGYKEWEISFRKNCKKKYLMLLASI